MNILTTWRPATYDVWGNAKDGYEVNDVYRKAPVEMRLKIQVNNPGTPMQFESATPTDKQIRKVFGLGRTRIETDGDDITIYVNRARDGYPIGEMRCVSHASLSPIKIKS